MAQKILIAYDSAVMRFYLKCTLAQAGYNDKRFRKNKHEARGGRRWRN